jgi:outer membrane protein assembly factor BamB
MKYPIKKKTLSLLIISLLMILQIPFAGAQETKSTNWSQFRGANRNGVATEQTNLNQFPADGPKLLWKKELGAGFSELTISENKLYTMISEKIDSVSGSEFIVAFDAKTGDKLWRTKVDSCFFDTFGDGPRSTPIIGDKNIYGLSSYGKLTACSKKDGKLLWQIDFMDKYKSVKPQWAFSSSPMLIDNNLIVEVGGTEKRAFMSFDKNTGDELWNNGAGIATYSSPAIATIDNVKNIIFANGRQLHALNTQGDTLWTYQSKSANTMAMPVVFDTNKVFLSSVRSSGFVVLEIKNNKPSEITHGTNMKNDYSSSVYHDGCIYGFHTAALQCISLATGEKKWTKRGFGKGSLIRVNDQLLVLSDKGKLIQIEATPEAYNEMGSFQAIQGKSWTAPSFANGKLYVRNLTEMACYDLSNN